MKHVDWRLTGHGGLELFAQGWLPDGEPREVVVIAHGYAEHGGRYGNLIERLVPAGYALYAMDHRGHGRSAGKRAQIDRMAWVIEDLHRFVGEVRARHGGGRVKLLGHSMGGNVAFGYALRWPGDLSGLILSGPAIGTMVPAWQRPAVALLSALLPDLGTVELPAEAVSHDPAVVQAYTSDPLVTLGRMPARTAAEIAAAAAGYADAAPRMTLPVLIQHGEGDSLVPLDPNRAIYRAIGSTDKTIMTYPGLFHEIYNEVDHGAVIDDLVRWLEAHPAG